MLVKTRRFRCLKRRMRAIRLCAAGLDRDAIARAIGVSRRTVNDYLAPHPDRYDGKKRRIVTRRTHRETVIEARKLGWTAQEIAIRKRIKFETVKKILTREGAWRVWEAHFDEIKPVYRDRLVACHNPRAGYGRYEARA